MPATTEREGINRVPRFLLIFPNQFIGIEEELSSWALIGSPGSEGDGTDAFIRSLLKKCFPVMLLDSFKLQCVEAKKNQAIDSAVGYFLYLTEWLLRSE